MMLNASITTLYTSYMIVHAAVAMNASIKMTKSPVAHSRARARPVRRPAVAADRIAFLGSAEAIDPSGARLYAQAMCWPAIPAAWPALASAWHAVQAVRDEVRRAALTTPPISWIGACAPQLGKPFRDTTAEDSSLAALIVRAPIHVAVTLVASEASDTCAAIPVAVQRRAFARNLTHYGDHLRASGRRACAILVARPMAMAIEAQFQQELASPPRMAEATWLREFELRTWEEPAEPLPLELASVIAACVIRERLHREVANPIFDAASTKRVHGSFEWERRRDRRR